MTGNTQTGRGFRVGPCAQCGWRWNGDVDSLADLFYGHDRHLFQRTAAGDRTAARELVSRGNLLKGDPNNEALIDRLVAAAAVYVAATS